jgi:hypothetical protein
LTEYGVWRPYAGTDALALAFVLLVVGGAFAYLGIGLRQAVGVNRPGRALGVLLVLIWGLSFLTFAVAVGTYGQALVQQAGPSVKTASSPISPFTLAFALLALVAITWLSWRHGPRAALGSAIVGTIAAPMIFELPFDLIVMWRTPHPAPELLFMLLFFLPLFLWEISSFALLTLSPLTRVSRYTLFSLAAVFVVFAVWALVGFPFPGSPVPLALNVVAKALAFVAAITLFLPRERAAASHDPGAG